MYTRLSLARFRVYKNAIVDMKNSPRSEMIFSCQKWLILVIFIIKNFFLYTRSEKLLCVVKTTILNSDFHYFLFVPFPAFRRENIFSGS